MNTQKHVATKQGVREADNGPVTDTRKPQPGIPKTGTSDDTLMTATVTLDYCFQEVNPEFAKACLRKPHHFQNVPVVSIFGKLMFDSLARPALDSCFAGAPLQFEQWKDLPARGVCHLEISLTPVYDDAQNVIAAHLCMEDVTSRSDASGALQQAQAKFLSLFDGSPEPMLVSRLEDASVQAVNQAYLDCMGIEREEIIGRDAPDLYCNAADREVFVAQVKEHGNCSEFETRMKTKDGAMHVLLSASVFDVNDDPCMVTVIRDITAAREAELSLHRSSLWLTLLQQVTAIANRENSITDALQQCLTVFCSTLNGPVGHVYTPSHPDTTLSSAGIWYLQDGPDYSDVVESTREPLGGDNRRSQTGLPILIPDLRLAHRDDRTEALLAHGLKTAIEVPVFASGKLVALMELFSAEPPAFSSEVLDIFAQAAVQLSQVFERQQAQQKIDEEQRKFRALAQDLDVIIWEMTLPGQEVSFISSSAENVLGHPLSILPLATLWRDHVHPDHREGYLAFYNDQVNGANNNEYSYRFKTANGTYKWLTDIVRAVLDKQGETSLLRGVTYDVTEQMHTRRALQQSKHRFESLFHDTPAIFFSLNARAEVLAVNRFGANYLGYQETDLIGRDFLSIIYEDDREDTRNRIDECIANPGQVYRWQVRKYTKDGMAIWVRVSGRVIQSAGRLHELLIVGEDVNETQRLSDELQYQATHDSLTGIINRQEFERQVTELLHQPGGQSHHALCYLDLDQFKVINDACGHIAGDELLRQLTEKISTRVRDSDTIGRLGGDEFGILMRNCSIEQADRVAEQIRDLVESYRFMWDGKPFSIGVSIGLVPVDRETSTFQELLGAADVACYAAKDSGRNRVHIYHSDDADLTKRRSEMDWVAKINQALEEDRMLIYMQPIMQLADGPRQGDHYELLVRMIDDDGAIIPPGAFLPAAERYDLASKIDQWVISAAFNWFASHPEKIARLGQCNINLSGQSLAKAQVLDFILAQLDRIGLPAAKFCFEITETAAIQNLGTASNFMHTLKQRGCLFALDDFGSGLSSFSYLKQFPVDILKIDGAFVKNMVNDPIDFAMVQSINDIGHVMGKQTVAEFVEDNQTLEALRNMGVDYAQGYGVGKPVPFILPTNYQKLAS